MKVGILLGMLFLILVFKFGRGIINIGKINEYIGGVYWRLE